MTEAEWLENTRPADMLRWVIARQPDERRTRLLLCAAFRRVWHLLGNERLCEAITAHELSADGLSRDSEVDAADRAARTERLLLMDVRAAARRGRPDVVEHHLAVAVVALADNNEAPWTILDRIARGAVDGSARLDAWGSVKAQHADLIREVYGNPVLPVEMDPAWLAWRDGTIAKLARAAYEERDLPGGTFDAGRLAILADALEEAGCTTEVLLSHLRGPGSHVRGCWAVDLLLPS